MRGVGPIGAVVGGAALAWVLWEAGRVLWLRGVSMGLTSGPVLDWRVEAVGGSWGLEFLVPLLLVGVGLLGAGLVARVRVPDRVGYGVFGLGLLAVFGWTFLTVLAGVSRWMDTWVGLPFFFVLPEPLSWWTAWGRWWLDAAMLLAVAVLIGFGPREPNARRGAFAVLLAVLADSCWRAFVAVGSGQVPLLADPVQGWGVLLDFIWLLAGGFATAFVFVFANLADRDGPRPRSVLGLLAVAGLWLGLQGALLFFAGSLQAMGFDGRLVFEIPLYEALLSTLRLSLLLAGTIAIGLGLYREQP